jgi:hypothetical protein
MLTSLGVDALESGCRRNTGLDSKIRHSVVLCESATIIRSVTIHDIS